MTSTPATPQQLSEAAIATILRDLNEKGEATVSMLNVIRAFYKAGQQDAFCQQHGLTHRFDQLTKTHRFTKAK